MSGLFDPDFLDALESACRGPFEGTVWRGVIGSTDPLRANSRGGRWNPPGVEVLYCSRSEDGAELELSAVVSRQSVAITKPLNVRSLTVRLARVCDLFEDSPALADVGISDVTLTGETWKLPQRIGEAVEWLGVAGLIVPSARHPAGNLVILVNQLGPEDFYEVSPTD